jgi:hypothetical protein
VGRAIWRGIFGLRRLVQVEDVCKKRDSNRLGGHDPGDQVTVQGLQAKPEYNGQKGTCVSFDVEKERWEVRLHNGAQLCVKPSNLRMSEEKAEREQQDKAAREALCGGSAPEDQLEGMSLDDLEVAKKRETAAAGAAGIDFLWQYTALDILETVYVAAELTLRDSSVSAAVRAKRAEALLILSAAFYAEGQKPSEDDAEGEEETLARAEAALGEMLSKAGGQQRE